MGIILLTIYRLTNLNLKTNYKMLCSLCRDSSQEREANKTLHYSLASLNLAGGEIENFQTYLAKQETASDTFGKVRA